MLVPPFFMTTPSKGALRAAGFRAISCASSFLAAQQREDIPPPHPLKGEPPPNPLGGGSRSGEYATDARYICG